MVIASGDVSSNTWSGQLSVTSRNAGLLPCKPPGRTTQGHPLTIHAVSSIHKHAPLPLYRGVAVPSCWVARQAKAPLAVGVGLQVARCRRHTRHENMWKIQQAQVSCG